MPRRALNTAELRAPSRDAPRAESAAERRGSAPSTEEIRIIKARRPFAWLRALLLALGVMTVAAVLLLLAAYRFGQSRETPEADRGLERGTVDAGEEVLAGRSFDYTQTSEGVQLFNIQAEESRQDRDGTSYLTTVALKIFHEDGRTYTARSENAWFNEADKEARLEGDVVLSGWDDLVLEARALEFRQGGQVLESIGEVEFRYPPELVGRASHLKVDRQNDLIKLSGGVHLRSQPGAEQPMRLDCQSLVFQQEGGILRAVGKASLESDGQSLQAHYLTLFLSPDGKSLESIRARWQVVGRARVDDGRGGVHEVEYRGEFLDAQPDPQNPTQRKIKLDGEGDPVELSITDLSGLRRTFTGLYINGHSVDDRLTRIEGVGDPVVLVEALDLAEPHLLRRACAERITARFGDDGDVSRIQFERRVDLSDPRMSISGGETAQMNLADDSFRIEGREVVLTSSRGEISAPRLSWNRAKGFIKAASGVRAVLPEQAVRALRGTPLGQGSGPVQVEAEDAFWTSEPPTFTFEGDVRAWRGESLLLADQLLGDEREQKLAASGNVRTVWVSPQRGELLQGPQPPGDDRGGEGAAAATLGTAPPIEVNAARVSYLDGVHHLVYEEDVTLRQGRRTLSCQKLSVELGAAGRAERMICEDDVRLDDPESGRRVERGDRAVYTLAENLVEIFGDTEKVELYDEKNNQLRGGYVRYDMRTGIFRIRSRPQQEGLGASIP